MPALPRKEILMKNKVFLAVILAIFSGAIVVSALDALKVSRMGQNVILNQGGTSTTNGRTLVVSDSPTNEMRIVQNTATVAGAATAYTNNFTINFIATPTIIKGVVNGQNDNYAGSVVATVTTTNLVVSGMDATLTNNIPFILYGYKNTGVFQ